MDRDAARTAAREHPIHSASSTLSRPGLDFDPDATRFADFLPTFLTHVRNRWKPATVSNAARLGRRLCDCFGSHAVTTINRNEVVAWFESLTGSTIWPLSLLSSVMEHAEHLGLRPPGSNPCRGLRRKKSRFSGQPLTPEQYGALGRALTPLRSDSDPAGALIQFLALTGARRGEATDLRWSDIHEDRAVLPDSKTGPKTIWLCNAVRDLLASLPRQPGSTFVFRDDDRERFVRTVNAAWQEIRHAADLGSLRVHDLRHGFASVGLGMGMDLPTIAGLLGHADIGTTSGYAHLRSGHLANAVARVADRIAGPLKPRPTVRKRSDQRIAKQKPGPQRSAAALPGETDPDVTRYFTATKASDRELSAREFCSGQGLDFEAFKRKLRDFRQGRQETISSEGAEVAK